MSNKFEPDDVKRIPELTIECPVCKAPAGEWCPSKTGGLGLHAKRIDEYHWCGIWDDRDP